MHGSKGERRPRPYYGQNLLVAFPSEDEMPYAYRSSLHPFWQQQQQQQSTGSSSIPSTQSRDSWEARVRPKVLDEESLFSVNIPPGQPVRRRTPRVNPNVGGTKRRKWLYRCFQISSLLIIGISLYALVENIKYLIQTYDNSMESDKNYSSSESLELDGPAYSKIREELQSWIIHENIPKSSSIASFSSTSSSLISSTETSSILSSKLKDFLQSTNEGPIKDSSSSPQENQKYVLNIKNLTFDINNSSLCLPSTQSNSSTNLGDGIYFMIIVHSSPEHFEARQAIRSTWGSVKSLKDFAIRLIFVLGKSGDWMDDADFVESSVARESELFGDIVSGVFIDSYRNLTYKHLLGYKWALEFCPGSAFILKTDDDAFIDMFQLFDFITRTYGFKPSPATLVCNVFPEGTKPVRAVDTKGTKWAVSEMEYPHVIYPKYCGGLAYLVTPDTIRRILDVSDKVKFFWIDDVFVTGILRELTSIEPFYLNLRYDYDPRKYRKWLEYSSNSDTKSNSHDSSGNSTSSVNLVSNKYRRFPFMIAHVERGSKFSEEMNHLWRKTLRAWSEEQKK